MKSIPTVVISDTDEAHLAIYYVFQALYIWCCVWCWVLMHDVVPIVYFDTFNYNIVGYCFRSLSYLMLQLLLQLFLAEFWQIQTFSYHLKIMVSVALMACFLNIILCKLYKIHSTVVITVSMLIYVLVCLELMLSGHRDKVLCLRLYFVVLSFAALSMWHWCNRY